jgi:hypothetical protein
MLSRSPNGKPGTHCSHGSCDSSPQRLAEHRDAEEPEHDRGKRRDELDARLDDPLLAGVAIWFT